MLNEQGNTHHMIFLKTGSSSTALPRTVSTDPTFRNNQSSVKLTRVSQTWVRLEVFDRHPWLIKCNNFSQMSLVGRWCSETWGSMHPATEQQCLVVQVVMYKWSKKEKMADSCTGKWNYYLFIKFIVKFIRILRLIFLLQQFTKHWIRCQNWHLQGGEANAQTHTKKLVLKNMYTLKARIFKL